MPNKTPSLYEQIRSNQLKTIYLFTIFPLIILGLSYLATLISTKGQINLTNEIMKTVGFWVLIGVLIWSIISYTLGSKMIMAFAGAAPIKKNEYPELVRVVENAAIAAGLPSTPEIYIIEDQSLNAFATGTSAQNSKVAISRGLLAKLTTAELEAVMSHEVGHIVNKDIRVMLLSIALVGGIEMIGELLIRINTGGDNSKKNFAFFLTGLSFITIGTLIGTLARLAISREREYLADLSGAKLCSNPEALATALEKISQDARLEILDNKASIAGLCIADPSAKAHLHLPNKNSASTQKNISGFWKNLWSTHPPISDRIQKLRNL